MHLIRLLGGLSIDGPAGPVQGRAAQRRRLAVLALLAVEHPRPISRDRLAGLLWPESTEEQARHLLRDSLYVLRRALGEGAIRSSGDEIRLDADHLDCDLWRFTRAVDAENPQAAVRVYAGPFLQGVFIDGAGELDQWIELERARIARRYATALEALAELAEASGDARAAVRWWQALADTDPYDRRTAVRLVRALAAAGERAAALRHATAHTAQLESELGVPPDPELQGLGELLRQEIPADAVVPEPLPVPPLASAAGSWPGPTLRPRGLRRTVGVAAVLLMGSALALNAVRMRARALPQPAKHRVVVMPLENRTGDASLDAVGSVAADWITQGLVATADVQVVSFTSALGAARRMSAQAPTESVALPRRVARETDADVVVLGSYARAGDSLHFHVSINDAPEGRVLATSAAVAARAHAPLDGIEALRSQVVAELATTLNPQVRQHTQGASRPPDYAAYRAYAEGASRVIEGDFRGALEPLREAALDSSYTLPLIVLGFMHFNLGEYATADSVAAVAGRRRERLPPTDRALLDMLGAWLKRDHAAAYRAARAASALAPGSMSTAQMATEIRRTNRPRAAIDIFTSLDPTRGELRGDPYYWWDLTLAYHQVGDYRRELDAARRARALTDHQITRMIEMRALAARGRISEVRARVDDALGLMEPQAVPELLRFASLELAAHGHAVPARDVAERAIAWHRARPVEEQHATAHRFSLARTLYAADRWDEARDLLLELAVELPDDLNVHGMLGVIAARRGDRADAERIARLLADSRRPYLWSAPTLWRAGIAAQAGDHEKAIALLREVLAQGGLRDGFHTDPALAPLRNDHAFRALLKPIG